METRDALNNQIQQLAKKEYFPEYFCEYVKGLAKNVKVSDVTIKQVADKMQDQINLLKTYENR